MSKESQTQIDVNVGNKTQCFFCKYDINEWAEKCPLLDIASMPGVTSSVQFVKREHKRLRMVCKKQTDGNKNNGIIGGLIRYHNDKKFNKVEKSLMNIVKNIHENCVKIER